MFVCWKGGWWGGERTGEKRKKSCLHLRQGNETFGKGARERHHKGGERRMVFSRRPGWTCSRRTYGGADREKFRRRSPASRRMGGGKRRKENLPTLCSIRGRFLLEGKGRATIFSGGAIDEGYIRFPAGRSLLYAEKGLWEEGRVLSSESLPRRKVTKTGDGIVCLEKTQRGKRAAVSPA